MDEETAHWVAFSVFPGIGPVRFKLLFDYFGSAEKAWRATSIELREVGLGEKLITSFNNFKKTFPLGAYVKKLDELNIHVLTTLDPRYPKLLSMIPDAPFLLYVLGKNTGKPIDMTRTIAVVGTRKITRYGEEVTKRLVEGLVAYGFTIVSGLAYGVDAVAHQTAIDAGGKTVAVLGCGIDIVAPPSNARLYRDIAGGAGAIVSEMPLGLRPNKGLFPARNRIISGLSLGVVVTEGADDSGALITARNAGEQGREVFAVPGPITSPYSRGPAQLIKKGAKLVETVEDIIEELGIDSTRKKSRLAGDPPMRRGETKEEQKILDLLADRQMQIDELVRAANLTIAVVGATLSVLEMKGMIKDYGRKEYGLT